MLMSALAEIRESLGDCRISPGDPGNTLWLSDRIRRLHLEYDIANSPTSVKVQCQHAKPCFTKVKKPGVVAVLLGHRPSVAHDLQSLSEPAHTKESDGFSAEREKVLHQTPGLIKLRNTPFKHVKSFPIVALKRLDVGVNQ